MMRKISSKSQSTGIKLLEINSTKITNKIEIANTLAETFSKISKIEGNKEFQTIKEKAEKHKLNFTGNNSEYYNTLFTLSELKESIKSSHSTSAGLDEIQYEFIKHLPKASIHYFLDMVNYLKHGIN